MTKIKKILIQIVFCLHLMGDVFIIFYLLYLQKNAKVKKFTNVVKKRDDCKKFFVYNFLLIIKLTHLI